MNFGRRRLLQGGAGAAAGICFTPAPWRLLHDCTLRTQNTPWAAPLPRGEITMKPANCTLCAGGCAASLRCVGGVPFGAQPAGEALCPAAFAAHHLAFHPDRLRGVLHRGAPSTREAALAALRQRIAAADGAATAVLDLAPGRTASLLHRYHLASIRNGIYCEPPAIEGATAAAVARLLSKPVRIGLDFERTRTVISLGTPLLEGWAPPRHVFQRSGRLRVIQVEPVRSHTADVAAEWMAIQPGSELAFLLGVAGVLRHHALPALEIDEAARRTGLRAEQIIAAAEALSDKPAVVLADRDPANGPHSREVLAVAAALNAVAGGVGVEGGFAPALAVPAPRGWAGVEPAALDGVPDGSIAVLIVDDPLPGSAVDWRRVESKLRPDALVVASTWTRSGVAGNAEWLIPCPVYLESRQDAAEGAHTIGASWRLSPAMLEAPPAAIDGAALVGLLAGDETPTAQRFEERAAAIRGEGRGWLTRPGQAEPVAAGKIEAKDFWTALQQGARWHAAAPASGAAIARLLPEGFEQGRFTAALGASSGLPPRAAGWRPAASSPLLAKLWQDTDLKAAPPRGVRS